MDLDDGLAADLARRAGRELFRVPQRYSGIQDVPYHVRFREAP
jgi:hypothetical protein